MKFTTALLIASTIRGQGIIDLSRSPYAKLHPVPVRAVRIGDGFWSPRRQVNVEKSLPTMLELLEAHGIVDNFRRVSGRKQVERKGPLYTDSDLYKWTEAAAFVLQNGDRPELRTTLDRLTDDVVAAQEPSGYLNTFYQGDKQKLRFTEMQRSHELYCLGHMLQAGIARYRADGNRRLLDAGMKFVDYLVRDFGPDKRPLLTGHPELEMSLVELYRVTGKKEYLGLAGYLLSGVERDRLKLRDSDVKYMFSGKPFTSRTEFEGHAVRAMYAASGATDYYLETGNEEYKATLDRLWTDMDRHKMYITGGVGSRSDGEAFGDAYELPNMAAYTESCAAIGNMFWNERLLHASGDSRYADVLERALYNGVNSGMSLDGTLYCYRNPLASAGEKIRNPWYDTTCCPPNLERVLASLPGIFLQHQPGRSLRPSVRQLGIELEARGRHPDPRQAADQVSLGRRRHAHRVTGESDRIHSLRANTGLVEGYQTRFPRRIGRAASGQVLSDKEDVASRRCRAAAPGYQASIDCLQPACPRELGQGSGAARTVVYCLEQRDQPGERSPFDLALASPEKPFSEDFRKDLLGGVVVLMHPGSAEANPSTDQPLYQSIVDQRKAVPQAATLTFVPYYSWANRGPSSMEVWVRLR